MNMRNHLHISVLRVAAVLLLIASTRTEAAEVVSPGTQWEQKTPSESGMDAAKLKAFSRFTGGRGCVVRHGYLVYSWGDVSRLADVASVSKPFYSHLLWKAIEDGQLKSVDAKAVKWEPRLGQINTAMKLLMQAVVPIGKQP